MKVHVTNNHKIPRKFRGKTLYKIETCNFSTIDGKYKFASSGKTTKKNYLYLSTEKDATSYGSFSKEMHTQDGFLIEARYVIPVQPRAGEKAIRP